jgi:anoctamin-10
LYFAFLATYTKSLTPIAILGASFHFLGERYSPLYSIFVVLWATFFAEYWAVCERKVAVRWGSYGNLGANKLSKNRAAKKLVLRFWVQDFWKLSRLVASVAVLLGFMCVLVLFAAVAFLSEAFLAILYKGPGSQLAVGVNFLVSIGKVDVMSTAYHPNDSLCCQCPNFVRHLSIHCDS